MSHAGICTEAPRAGTLSELLVAEGDVLKDDVVAVIA